MKTQMSRFHIHDDLSAPEGSLPVLKGAMASGGQLPNFLGVLAGSPAALRAYARFRSELRHGSLALPTLERISLAVAEHYRSQPGHRHAHAHRAPGGRRDRRGRRRPRLGVLRPGARPRCCATCARSSSSAATRPMHLHEEAREAGWSDEQLLEAIAYVVARVAHRDGQRRGRGAGRRLVRGHPRPAGRVGFTS